MEEAKAKKKTGKQITLKNKSAVKKSLAKASIKGKTAKTVSKTTKKATTIKKKAPSSINKELINTVENTAQNDEVKIVKEQQNKKTVIKAPNNIKRKITYPSKAKKKVEEEKKQTLKPVEVEEKDKETKIIEKELAILTNKDKKRLEKKKQKEERKKKKEEAKRKKLEAKKKAKEKEEKEKKKQKEEKGKKKFKIEFPKEWATINTKKTKKEKAVVEEAPKTFKGKLKSSIFESIDEKELEERKRKSVESLKVTIIVLLCIAIGVGVLVYALLRYNDYVRKQLAVYEPYRIGDKVKLKDESIWYVIKDSDSKDDKVRLLANFAVDVNDDGVIDDKDFVKYNSNNKAEFDTNDEGSVAYLLNGPVKDRFEKTYGKLDELNIMTSKEYVKVRERMNFGDQWDSYNWLAYRDFQKWWILSDQNDKVYIVTERGTFYLTSPSSEHIIRPAITINKDLVTKIEEKKNITVDLINGLKRK